MHVAGLINWKTFIASEMAEIFPFPLGTWNAAHFKHKFSIIFFTGKSFLCLPQLRVVCCLQGWEKNEATITVPFDFCDNNWGLGGKCCNGLISYKDRLATTTLGKTSLKSLYLVGKLEASNKTVNDNSTQLKRG